MCGIAGIVGEFSGESAKAPLNRMLEVLHHRGPDDRAGVVGDGFALGMVRLAIVDLAGGVQPALSEDRCVALIFNGEIFNYMALREELIRGGYRFNSRSEVETLLALYLTHGPEMVKKLNGQFAIAIWDGRVGRLHLFRDPLGIRPLFWQWHGERFFFASEMKGLVAATGQSPEISQAGLLQIIRFWSVIGETTPFSNIRQVPPGHFLTLQDKSIQLSRYWQWPMPETLAPLHLKDDREYVEAFREQFQQAVQRQAMADVEVGSYLSGGVDSSIVSSLMVERVGREQLRTFSITFDDKAFDESAAQQVMVDHLGVQHTRQHVTHHDIATAFPDVVRHVETPLFRTAATPLFLLSKKVREAGIKVVMTGEGADEVLLGYDLFRETRIRQFWGRAPNSKWRGHLLRRIYGYLPQYQDLRYFNLLQGFYRQSLNEQDHPHFGMLVRWGNGQRIEAALSPQMRDFAQAHDPQTTLDAWLPDSYHQGSVMARTQCLESMTLLSNHILWSQGDRASLAHSVEGRYPFLDTDFIQFAARLPEGIKLRGLKDKFILRESYKKELPNTARTRPKLPYQAPEMAAFFPEGKPLAYVQELLSEQAVREGGLFDPGVIARLLQKTGRESLPRMGFRENMTFVLALSTALLQRDFGRFAHPPPPEQAGEARIIDLSRKPS
ncbi:MAG: asparagine synthase (glutamine-hydrolyzing) [Magnetococcales bacterium]|nr:asparagine synthase (glutamine-hydrolyzing) [Magnetococcales bacterium]